MARGPGIVLRAAWVLLACVSITAGVAAADSLRRRQQTADTLAPRFRCVAEAVPIKSSTLVLPLPSLFANLTDDDQTAGANITVTVRSAAGDLLGSASVSPNAGAASAAPSWDACTSADGMEGIRLTDSGVIGRGDSSVLPNGGDYQNNIDCYWRLSCSNPAATPALTFASFDTQLSSDYLSVRDGASHSGAADLVSPQHGWGAFEHVYTWEFHYGSYLSGRTALSDWDNHGSRAAAEAACICKSTSNLSLLVIPRPCPDRDAIDLQRSAMAAVASFTIAEVSATTRQQADGRHASAPCRNLTRTRMPPFRTRTCG